MRRALLGGVLAAGSITPLPSMGLIGASVDDARRYEAVVVVVIGTTRRCTATKIAAHRFLTAAHCVTDTTRGVDDPAAGPGREIHLSNVSAPGNATDFLRLHVERVHLPPAFVQALERLADYRQSLVRKYRETHSGVELERRIRAIDARNRDATRNHFTGRFPDVAVIEVRERTAAIPVASIDFGPLAGDESVHLVGYGCDRLDANADRAQASSNGRRRWGESRVIRVDEINFYTFAHRMRPGAPSTCPGDSGGPVMRAGKVVGVHGKVYGLADRHGARSNMSVNLQGVRPWLELLADPTAR